MIEHINPATMANNPAFSQGTIAQAMRNALTVLTVVQVGSFARPGIYCEIEAIASLG